jgi:hypothetical protein
VKNRATIKLTAAEWSTTVRGDDGQPIRFDHRTMSAKENKNFVVMFVRMFREAGLP